MKTCTACGTVVLDDDNRCAACGALVSRVQSVGLSEAAAHHGLESRQEQPARRRVDVKALAVFLTGLVMTGTGFLLMLYSLTPPLAPLGFWLFLFGLLMVGAITQLFRGLPYQQNTGWHRSGDPDLVRTMVRGSPTSAQQMYDADRMLEMKEQQDESD